MDAEQVELFKLSFMQAFGPYRIYFHPDAVGHPAKYHPQLITILVEKYCRRGDVMLDPMCGTGLGNVVAALHGCDTIGVDIEGRYIEWCLYAKEKVEKHSVIGGKGSLVFIQGDSRRLTELLAENLSLLRKQLPSFKNRDSVEESIDVIITSPPYGDALKTKKSVDMEREIERLKRIEEDKARRGVKWSPSSEESIRREVMRSVIAYGSNPRNIGNLNPDPVILKYGIRGIANLRFGKEDYFRAMWMVLQECWNVLKPSGKMIIVVKNIIRDGKLIPLHRYFIDMAKMIGFRAVSHLKFELPALGFFRVVGKRRGVWNEDLKYEHALVLEKS